MSFVFSSGQLAFLSFFSMIYYIHFNIALTMIYFVNCYCTSMINAGFCSILSSGQLMLFLHTRLGTLSL